mmetsp:Transcript_104108/g.325756  ORF Transcript_104108/g.325756 Transcript_104108/m.325756 type:complete len:228 (-) Transcript_104108:341-1024(-)
MIMRSSRKNFMIRMTLAMRTTRTTRRTRSTVMFPRTSLRELLSTAMLRRRSRTLNTTMKTSRMFHHMSSLRKKPMSPLHTQRRPSSTLKRTLKADCRTRKAVPVCTCNGLLFAASNSACDAMCCVCQPMNMALRKMSMPLNTSYWRLSVMRSSSVRLSIALVCCARIRYSVERLCALRLRFAEATAKTVVSPCRGPLGWLLTKASTPRKLDTCSLPGGSTRRVPARR